MRVHEVLEHRQALAERGLDGLRAELAVRTRHQALHARERTDLGHVARRAGLDDRRDRVGVRVVGLHGLTDLVGGLLPELDQVALDVALERIVKGCVAAGAALELVEEVVDHFVERQVVLEQDAVALDVLHVAEGAALVLAEFHDRAHVVLRRDDLRVDEGLLHPRDLLHAGQVGGVVDGQLFAVGLDDVVDHAGGGGDQVQVELALQPLLDDLHVQ